jgi:hypothetical protein
VYTVPLNSTSSLKSRFSWLVELLAGTLSGNVVKESSKRLKLKTPGQSSATAE